MNIRELYESRGEVLARAFKELQDDSQLKVPELISPEIIDDNILSEWLALNYLWTVDFRSDRNPIMGKIGGIIPTNPEDGKRVLAIANSSMGKVMYGTDQIKEAETTGNETIISQLEKDIGMPLEYMGDVTVVNGTRNVANYDFTSEVARTSPLDLLITNPYLLLSSKGAFVFSHKCLDKEQYVFNVPVNPKLFERIAKDSIEENYEAKLDVLKGLKETIIPNNFIAGFNIKYQEEKIYLTPVISETESEIHSDYLYNNGLMPKQSEIKSLGRSNAHGGFGIIQGSILRY